MELTQLDFIFKARKMLAEGRLADCIAFLKKHIPHGGQQYAELLLQAEGDYGRMLDFYAQGYPDEQRVHIFTMLCSRLSAIIHGISLQYQKNKSQTFIQAMRTVAGRKLEAAEVKDCLEDFVANAAMLSLETEPARREEQRRALYTRHYDDMDIFFNEILLSEGWCESDASDFAQLLTSPTIDVKDQQTLVGAITLAALQVPDFYKFACLARVFEHASDEDIRQRAFVGWAFAASALKAGNYAGDMSLLDQLCDNPQVRNDLFELAVQAFYCCSAEKDSEHIQKSVMPGIIENGNLQASRFGMIEEKEEDEMEQILHPDADDKRMEAMEQAMKQIENMQRQGRDIYFGGFSQMKRFPFFYKISAWFLPFDANHPALFDSGNDELKSMLLQQLRHMPFCEGDKFSFALALGTVLARLPENLKDLMRNGGNLADGMNAEVEGPAYIRRRYLQDLYRFYRLYPTNSELLNPFEQHHGSFVFLVLPQLKAYTGKVEEPAERLARFLLKKEKTLFTHMASCLADNRTGQYLKAYADYVRHDYGGALARLEKITPDCEAGVDSTANDSIVRLEAKLRFLTEDYSKASEIYGRLHSRYPNNLTLGLQYGAALLNAGDTHQSVPLLAQLNYEHPNDPRILRLLAWAYVLQGHPEKGVKIYDKLRERQEFDASDYMNAGYCYWFCNQRKLAASMFLEAAKGRGGVDEVCRQFKRDADLMGQYGVEDFEILMMSELMHRDCIV